MWACHLISCDHFLSPAGHKAQAFSKALPVESSPLLRSLFCKLNAEIIL